MGTKWASSTTLDGGTDLWRTLAGTLARVKLHLVKAYSANDSYATVISNSLGSVDMVAGDFVQSGGTGSPRVTTVPAKAIALSASSGASPNLQGILVDSTGSAVLYALDEVSDQVVTSGATFTLPSWTYAVNQPT